MKFIPLIGAGAVATVLALTAGGASLAHSHHSPARVSHATSGGAVAASSVSSAKTVPALTGKSLTKLSKSHIIVRVLSSSSRSGVLPLAQVASQSPGYAKAVREGRVHASLARISIPNSGKVKDASAKTLSAVDPDVDGELAWVLTYHSDDVQFQPTVPAAVVAEDADAANPPTETLSADSVVAFDANTGEFLYAAIY